MGRWAGGVEGSERVGVCACASVAVGVIVRVCEESGGVRGRTQ